MVRCYSDLFSPRLMSRMGLDLLYKDASVSLNQNDVLSRVHLPSLLSNVLLVYRVTAIHAEGQSCSGELNCYIVLFYSSRYYRTSPSASPRARLFLGGPLSSTPTVSAITPTYTHRRPLHIISIPARPQSHPVHLARLSGGCFASAHRLVGYARPCCRSILDGCARMGCW